jgi:hypothetical protein
MPLVSKTFSEIITFTRASTGTFTDSAGVLQTAAINAPRFDYNPTTLVAQGFLVEEARTNLLLNSNTLSTQSVTVTAVAHTLSFYGTGVVTLTGASTAGPLVGTGAYPNRVTLTFTPTAGTLTLTVTGSVQFANLEAGSFATSYIPTTTATVTRAADVASINTLSPWFNATEGSFFVQASNLFASAPALFSTDDGTTNNRIINFFSNPTTPAFRVISGGVDQANISSGVISLQSTFKLASAYKVNDFAASLNGAAAVVDTSGTIPSGQTTARLGSNVVTAGLINGYLQRITYYPRRLTNAELQTLTA